jgi:hypothetical protein
MNLEGGLGSLDGRGARGGFTRTALTACVAVAAVFTSMTAVGSAAPATVAAPIGKAAPAQAPGIDAGRASARANVLSVAPSTGSLQFALGSGEVIAETTGGLAQAQSSAADLGLIGSSLTSENCVGDQPLEPEQLPHPLVIDNRSGPGTAEESEAPGPVPGTSGGHKVVEATATPSSRAEVTFVDAALPGLVSVGGGQAVAEAEVFPGAGREARADVVVDVILLDGAVALRGMRWSVRHRTGGEDGAEGAFSIDALELAGVPVPVDSADQAVTVANQALGALGLQLEMPEVVRIQEGTVDLIRVTPMRLVLADSPAGQLAVRPALEATREARSQLFDALVAADCRMASFLLVGEIGIGVAAGTGTLIASFGGAEATSANVVHETLFGQLGGPLLGGDAGVAPATDSAVTPARPATSAAPATPGVVTQPGSTVGATPASAFDRICENVHPIHKPSCSQGAAATVGLLGLGATAAVGFLDLRRRRRPVVAAGVEAPS